MKSCLEGQCALSPHLAIWLCWGRITPSKSTLLRGISCRTHLVFPSCCLNWKSLFPNMLKASKSPSDGWDGGDCAKAPQPGGGESPWYHTPIFQRKTAKPVSSFAPGQTRFITVSPTCLRVPEVTRERWLDSCLQPKLVFLSHICRFGGAPPGSAETAQREGQSPGRANGDRLCPQGVGDKPLRPPVGGSRDLRCLQCHSQPWDESGRLQK